MNKYNFELNLNDRNSLSLLINRIKPNSIVLEFGPANGRMTKHMKEQLNCKVYAVEIDENAANDTAQYTEKIIVDSIENYNWKIEFNSIQFDYIIFADVLEHLYYPEKVLQNVKEFLKEDGSILVSIPNIAHNSIIINLMKNEFNYSPTGLLDDTHIRFFTKKTFDNLIRKTGYFTNYETAIYLNPENTEFSNSYKDVLSEIGKYLRSLPCGEIYQFIYEIKKNKTKLISDFSDIYKIYQQLYIQLFIGEENGFSEENSIKLPVFNKNEIQKFEFDLKDKKDIKSLRLDPLNDSCVIEIERLYLMQKDLQEVDLIPLISANDCSHKGSCYFFDFFDPNICFTNLDLEILNFSEKLCIELKYNYISEDAVHVCANQIASDKNQRISVLEDEIISVHNSISWKITRPLRIINKKIKNLRKRLIECL